jgi:uncharacterized metal-binding protein
MTCRELPLVYACSGCSSAAQLANHLAVRLDRTGAGEMSCIAGVGGDVPALVRTARSGRRIVALDGCPLRCVRSTLARHGLTPALQLTLSEHGVAKRKRADFDPAQAEALLPELAARVRALSGEPRAPTAGSGSARTSSSGR